MAVRIVSLLAKIGLDGAGFQRGLASLKGLGEKFAGDLKSRLAGTFSVAAIGLMIRHVSNAIGRIKDLSEQFSVTTDEVQRLDAAAKMSGQTFEDIGAATEKLGKARQEAAEGNDDLRKQFSRFGVSLKDLNDPARRNIDLLQQMAFVIRGMNLTAADSQALRDLFGKSGARLAAVFADLEKVKLSPIENDDILAIDEMNKRLEVMKQHLVSLAAQFPNLRAGDFNPFSGTGTPGSNAPAMSADDVAAANARKHFQSHQAWLAGPEGPLFTDKAKAKAKQDALEAEAKLRERILKIQIDESKASEKKALLEQKAQEHLNKANEYAKKGEADKAAAEAGLMADALLDINAVDAPKGKGSTNLQLTSNEQAGAFAGEFAFETQEMTRRTAENSGRAVDALKEIIRILKGMGEGGKSGPFGSK